MIICTNRFRISVCILFACLLFSVSTHSSACAYPGVLTLSQYSQASDTTAPRPLSLKLVAVYPSDPEEVFLPAARAIRNIAIDTTGNVYVADSRNHRLLSFNPDGEMRWSVGQSGMGPGDFSRPKVATDGKNRLFVYHRSRQRVDVFSTEGRYIKSLPQPPDKNIIATQILYIKPDTLILTAGTGYEYAIHANVYHIVDDELVFIRQLRISEEPELPIPTGYYFYQPVGLAGQFITTGSVQHHQFRLSDLKGRTVDSLSRELNTGIRPIIEINREGVGIVLELFGKSGRLLKIDESLFLHTYYKFKGESPPDREVIFRNFIQKQVLPELQYTYTMEILGKGFNTIATHSSDYFISPDSGKVIATDGKGHIYTVKSGKETTIRKYRLEY